MAMTYVLNIPNKEKIEILITKSGKKEGNRYPINCMWSEAHHNLQKNPKLSTTLTSDTQRKV